jgi:hypothetical protein
MPSTINAQAGNALAFTSLIKTSDGTANLTLQTNGANAITIDNNQNANFVSTGATRLPSGTTAQRPASPINGMMRYNTTTLSVEGYANNTWVAFL